MSDTTSTLTIFSPENTSRLQYTFQLVFSEILGIEHTMTHDRNQFLAYTGPKLSYSKERLSDEPFIHSLDLLSTSGISEQAIEIHTFREIKALFYHDHSSDLPFDIFSAVFYLVTRYEEYLPFTADQYGRFPDHESLNVREGFHELAIVNRYAQFLQELLQLRYSNLRFPDKKYRFTLTYDIDMAYAYREKGLLRNLGGFLNSAVSLRMKDAALRTSVLLGKERDPFDTFDYQIKLHEKNSLVPIYFFLLGDHTKHDKNIHWQNPSFRKIIKIIAERYPIGTHASYRSNDNPSQLLKEINRLATISGKPVSRNRQHFLKLHFPETYRNLLECGVTEDYTMGYASLIGFRAGICQSYLFYDLQKEETTKLRIYPFSVMDATLHYYLKLSADDALQRAKKINDEVKRVNGEFIFLAHNDLISERGSWPEWRKKFEELISYSKEA